jgi:hypothetical protein
MAFSKTLKLCYKKLFKAIKDFFFNLCVLYLSVPSSNPGAMFIKTSSSKSQFKKAFLMPLI